MQITTTLLQGQPALLQWFTLVPSLTVTQLNGEAIGYSYVPRSLTTPQFKVELHHNRHHNTIRKTPQYQNSINTQHHHAGTLEQVDAMNWTRTFYAGSYNLDNVPHEQRYCTEVLGAPLQLKWLQVKPDSTGLQFFHHF